jgi:xanthine dehydrogenase molybdenum-binding subunit
MNCKTMNAKSFQILGQDFPRKAGAARVSGRELYPSDLTVPGMLHGRILRSPHPHARVKSIDFSPALALGAVVLGPADVPDAHFNLRQVSVPRAKYKDWQVLSDHVRQVGDPFAAVAAESEQLAQAAAEAVKVEWELLPAYLTTEQALACRGPQIHDRIWIEDRALDIADNVACTREVNEGDVTRGFADADLIVENEFLTPRVYHAQLEPRSCLARPEADGGLTVWPSTQALHNTRILIGEVFDLPLNKVNVVQVAGGGHFGSGIQTNPATMICVALALKACRPVRIVQTREEDMYDHCRYETRIILRIGAKKDGTLVAADMKAVVDIGCHHIQALAFLGVLAGWLHSLYRLQSMRYSGVAVYTNKAPSCAMQGYGAPQVHFVMESTMGMLAEKLGMDPVELRLKNYVGLGEIFWGQGPTVRSLIQSDGVKELLARGTQKIGWQDRLPPEGKTGRFRRGIGMARGFHTTGTGAPVPGEVKDYSTAMVKVNEDGSIDLLTALMDHGGGTLDAAAKLVAEEFCVPFDRVGLSPADTRSTGYDVCTHATRGVYCGGGAALEAAREAKKIIFEYASRLLGAPVNALKLERDAARGQGVVTVVGMPEKRLTLAQVATEAMNNDWGTAIAVKSVRMTNCPPAYTAFFVEVEVDAETGAVRILRVVAGSDAGTVINPALARGQLTGGFYRGASMALLENTAYDPSTGELTNHAMLTDYKMLGAADMPEPESFESFFAGTYEPTGPMGAKGIGEAALNPVPAAVAAAVQNAVGVWFTKLPILPEDIVRAVRARESARGGAREAVHG